MTDTNQKKSIAREYVRNELQKDMAPFYQALGVEKVHTNAGPVLPELPSIRGFGSWDFVYLQNKFASYGRQCWNAGADSERLKSADAIEQVAGPLVAANAALSEANASLRERVAELERELQETKAAAKKWVESEDLELFNTRAELDRLRAELDTERMRLAACGVIAMANTAESAAEQRKMLPEYWSGSAESVAAAVDREMRLRAECEKNKADAERYRWLRESATVRSDCGQWVVSCGDDWLPVPESDEYQPLQENTEPEACREALCDNAIDAARAAREG